MPIARIQEGILSSERYRQAFVDLVDYSVAREFPTMASASGRNGHFDWSYLLFCASVMARSADDECQEHALRIATTCITTDNNTTYRDAAAVVLNELSNRRAIELAIDRNFIAADISRRFGIIERLQWFKRELEQSILLSNAEVIYANRFQRDFWDTVRRSKWISVSAPTSVGKSYITIRWLLEQLSANQGGLAIIIAPTRALIHQVETDLRHLKVEYSNSNINITSTPIAASVREGATNILVFTQERLQVFLNSFEPEKLPRVDFLYVDEAQKVGDGSRGVLLQDAIERVVERNAGATVVFSSPMSANPEILLEDAPPSALAAQVSSNEVTVNQNLLWARQRKGRPDIWEIDLCRENEIRSIGTITLSNRPTSLPKRLAFLADSLATPSGNVIYVNGAADAEKVAVLLYELQGDSASVDAGSEIPDLIDFTRSAVHNQYLLARVLERRVAFHYGNMPLLLRTEIERLFSTGEIRFLVCTSTLIEGVNLPCRSLFVRAPTKGRGQPMSDADFWNLAGRAGRWGKEFQGNIICIDPDRWKEAPPRARQRYHIVRAVDDAFRSREVLEYIESRTPRETSVQRPDLESQASYLISIYLRKGSLSNAVWGRRFTKDALARFDVALGQATSGLRILPQIVARHPGISPLAMDRLISYFEERQSRVDEMVPVFPSSNDATDRYIAILHRINSTLAPVFGIAGRTSSIGILVTNWMRGYPLRRIIEERISYLDRTNRPYKLQAVIRQVMAEVEVIARFQAPRYLACYTDVLRQYLGTIGKSDLMPADLDLSVLLEYGVPGGTTLSLMGLGLSRTSALAVAEYIVSDQLDEAGALEWLSRDVWQQLGLPEIVKREIANVLRDNSSRSA